MKIAHFAMRVAAAFFIAWHLALTLSVAQPTRHLTMEDYLSIEAFGGASIDPTGRWLVYEKKRPYEKNTDFSYRTYAFLKSGHQIWRYDLHSSSQPELLPGLDQAGHTYLQNFSPDGRYLTFFQYTDGELKFGTYDNLLEFARFSFSVPTVTYDGDQAVIWTSNRTLVYAAIERPEANIEENVRVFTGRTLAAAWENAWSGKGPTAHVIEANFNGSARHWAPVGKLVEFNAETGAESVVTDGVYTDLMLSPDGSKLAALRLAETKNGNGGAEWSDLCVVDIAAGQSRCFSHPGSYIPETSSWAPDSERIAVFTVASNADIATGRFVMVDMRLGEQTRYEHFGLDLASKRERGRRHRPERPVFLGDDLVVFARESLLADAHVPEFSPKDVRWVGTRSADWFRLSEDGTSNNLTVGLSGASPHALNVAAGTIIIASDDGVFRHDLQNRRSILGAPFRGRLSFPRDRRYLEADRLVVQEPYHYVAIESRSIDGTQVHLIAFGKDGVGADVSSLGLPPGAAVLAATVSPPSVVIQTQSDGVISLEIVSAGHEQKKRVVEHLNDHLTSIDLGEWKSVSYDVSNETSGGKMETLTSCVLLPLGFNPAQPPPLVVDVYPHRRPNCDRQRTYADITNVQPFSAYLWAARGYAYAHVDLPGHIVRTSEGPLTGMSPLIDHALDAILAQGWGDRDRMVLVGISQGATSALYAAGINQRFDAVIAVNGWADFVSHYFAGSGVYGTVYDRREQFKRYEVDRGSDFALGKTPFEDPELYYRNSPIFMAPLVSAPILLVHSDLDTFHMSQFDEMFGALKRAGKRVRYIRYFGEGHGPSSPANIRDMWKRFDEFLCDAGAQSTSTQCNKFDQ